MGFFGYSDVQRDRDVPVSVMKPYFTQSSIELSFCRFQGGAYEIVLLFKIHDELIDS